MLRSHFVSAVNTLILTALATCFSLLVLEVAGRFRFAADVALVRDPDHRPQPNTRETNSDGIRTKREATSFHAGDTNIIILGDSFAYGFKQYPEVALPQKFEALARQTFPHLRVNVANFAWVSSSPYLSLRLLKTIGEKYRPTAVFLCVDMTDFHDDLKYRYLVEKPSIEYRSLGLAPGIVTSLKKILSHPRLPWLHPLHDKAFGLPSDRFFIVNAPLTDTEQYSAAILESIRETNRYVQETLRARFIVLVFPRSFQYSRRESPDNWERDAYTILGPYVLEPFVLCERWRRSEKFPTYCLLDDFKNADVFPTALYDDPHWTVEGHALAAKLLLKIAIDRGILPANQPSSPDVVAAADTVPAVRGANRSTRGASCQHPSSRLRKGGGSHS